MQYRTTAYAEDEWTILWYEKNLQGDIVAVYNQNGTKIISYDYDAWGNAFVTYHNGVTASSLAAKTPFRYRGYYYDTDLDLYYLGSRYYDSNTGRFINADSSLYHGLTGYNMFIYCNNNPVNYYDPTGELAIEIAAFTVLVEFLKFAITAIVAVIGIGIALDALEDVADAIENAPSQSITEEEEKEKEKEKNQTLPEDTVIYRYYSKKDKNLAPRKNKDYNGLSFSTELRPGVDCVQTTIGAVNSTGILRAIQTSSTHVIIVPTTGSVIEWMEQGMDSVWSRALSNIVVEVRY